MILFVCDDEYDLTERFRSSSLLIQKYLRKNAIVMQLPACRGSGLYYVFVGARMKTDTANSQHHLSLKLAADFAQQKSGGRCFCFWGRPDFGLADATKG
mmetsp:Transcript_7461/g.15310  ORF Transcript_7461/g.15310 Transcript_7461/m.15310 type:complete len:99 (-) Transcript_7461:296-592(-)